MDTGVNSEVTILLAIHNGADWLRPQLDSFVAQNHRNWRLIAADDGSVDASRDVIAQFRNDHVGRDITLCDGPRHGFAHNFLHLLRAAGTDAAYAALSDQDDVWLVHKLRRAVTRLQAVPPDLPALYCGRTLVCDSALRPLGRSPEFRRPPCFRNALLQNIGGGNTMVLNRPALALAQAASLEVGEIVSHDWWLYQLVTGAGGHVIYDTEPTVSYRQHGRNLVGANNSGLSRVRRAVMTVQGRFRRWNDINIAALTASAHRLTPENRALLTVFASARQNRLSERLRLLRDTGLHRQTKCGNASFWCAAMFGLV